MFFPLFCHKSHTGNDCGTIFRYDSTNKNYDGTNKNYDGTNQSLIFRCEARLYLLHLDHFEGGGVGGAVLTHTQGLPFHHAVLDAFIILAYV